MDYYGSHSKGGRVRSTRGMDDVVNLLLTELRDLLDPIDVPWDIEGLTPYGEMALRTGRQQQANLDANSSTQGVLDRWVNFLSSLQGKFPYATAAEIVWCVQAVGTSVMRDITMQQGKSFGAWWVTKCWVDEMIAFLAEQGGFMEYKSFHSTRNDQIKPSAVSRAASHHESRYSSGSDEFLRETGNGEGTSVTRPMDPANLAAINAAASHDDSGIGIRTPDEDFAIGKYDFSGQNTSNAGVSANDLIQLSGVSA